MYNFVLQSARIKIITMVLNAYKKTGINLIGLSEKNIPFPFHTDDLGMYYFIPKLSLLFNISVYRSAEFFLVCLLGLAFFSAHMFLFFIYKSIFSRVYSFCCFLSVFLDI